MAVPLLTRVGCGAAFCREWRVFEERLPAAPPTFCPVPASPLTVGCSTPGLLTPGGRRRPPVPGCAASRVRSLPSSSRSRRPRVHPRRRGELEDSIGLDNFSIHSKELVNVG